MHITRPSDDYYAQESERLSFRALTLSDVSAWTPFFDRDDYQRFLGQDITKPGVERAQFWIERQLQRKDENVFGQLAVIEKLSGSFIGIAGIIQRDIEETVEYEVTYSLLPEYWGNGYARELAKHFIDFAKENIATESIISMIHPENVASINVARANGLTLDGETEFMTIPVQIYRATL